MKISRATIAKKYPVQTGENIHGVWKSVDAVLKVTETIDGQELNDYIPVRFRGDQVEAVEALPEGTTVEVIVCIDANERISMKTNTQYLTIKDFVLPAYGIKRV